jgi:hypothetical protein
MTQLAYITQGHSEYEPRLRALLEESGIDPHEFLGLDWFSLVPFYVLAGATVTPEIETHEDHVHITGVRVTVPDDHHDGFIEALPAYLDDAYEDLDDDEEGEPEGEAEEAPPA